MGRGGGGGGALGAGKGGRGRLDFCRVAVLRFDSRGFGGNLGVPLILGGREGGPAAGPEQESHYLELYNNDNISSNLISSYLSRDHKNLMTRVTE